VDVGGDGPQEGEELLRDPRHRIPEWRRAELGLSTSTSGTFSQVKPSRDDIETSYPGSAASPRSSSRWRCGRWRSQSQPRACAVPNQIPESVRASCLTFMFRSCGWRQVWLIVSNVITLLCWMARLRPYGFPRLRLSSVTACSSWRRGNGSRGARSCP